MARNVCVWGMYAYEISMWFVCACSVDICGMLVCVRRMMSDVPRGWRCGCGVKVCMLYDELAVMHGGMSVTADHDVSTMKRMSAVVQYCCCSRYLA